MKTLIGLGSLLVLMFLYYLLFLNHVSINEVGVAYNSMNGQITVQDQPGWYTTSPLTFVTTFSTLPMKVTIPSNANVINTKVVRFKPEGVQEYIRMQGFSWKLSESSLENILLGYAYSGKSYPFLEIVQEGGPENVIEKKDDWHHSSDDKAKH